MDLSPPEKNDFLQHLFDGIPSAIFIVDDDVKIQYLNQAASKSFGLIQDEVFRKRGGDALHCIHSTEVPDGCGHAGYCRNCAIRNSVNEAIRDKKVVRSKTKMELITEGGTAEVYILVTASPLEYNDITYAILTIEDISELLQLRGLLPICAHCKKIRDDKNYWEHVESYMESQIDVEFTHSICPACTKEHFPEVFEGS